MAIIISGMLGVGKSLTSKYLADLLGTKVFYEPVENNPVLPEFYKDPKNNSFLLQTYLVNERYDSMARAQEYDILDRHIDENLLFAKVNHEFGNMTDVEYQTYEILFNNLKSAFLDLYDANDSLVVYLKADYDTILDRIKRRGRPYEQIKENDTFKPKYYKRLIEAYDEWYEKAPYKHKIMIDVSNNIGTGDMKNNVDVIGTIYNKLEQMKHEKIGRRSIK